MKNYNNILFDVDGTIIDPKEGIIKSVQYSLEKFNIKVNDFKKLECFIRTPLYESFKNYYNFNDDDTELAVKYYREYYKEVGIYKNYLYKGIIDVFEELKGKNKRLIVATSKPTLFTEKILKIHNIYKYFDFVSGATLDKTRIKKEDIIKFAIKEMNINSTENCIMIGDKKQDIIGANKNKMDSIGVLYGYGTLKELEEQKPTYIIKNGYEILEIV